MLISPNEKILEKQFYYLNQSYKIKMWNALSEGTRGLIRLNTEIKKYKTIKHKLCNYSKFEGVWGDPWSYMCFSTAY